MSAADRPNNASPRTGSEEAGSRRADHSLSALLALQVMTLFLVVPLAQGTAHAQTLIDVSRLAFALICITVLTRHRLLRLLLTLSILLMTAWPILSRLLVDSHRIDVIELHDAIAIIAFLFNGAVTGMVARHVFAAGRVTAHRVRGAVLLYLNLSSLFAIVYGALETHAPGAFGGSGFDPHVATASDAAFTYFSLTTITTTGFGDIVPLTPLARSLSNLEALIGQLFPATLLARLVALHLVDEQR